MKIINKIFSNLVVITLSLLLIGCDNEKKQNVLIVGTSADNPPLEWIQDNKIVGLDIDIINLIGTRLGKKIIIKNLEFNGLLAAIEGKMIDVAIAGLSVTAERQKNIFFSDPYISTSVAILTRAADNITKIEELDQKTLGVQFGTTWEIIVQDLSKEFAIKPHSLSNNLMLIEELKAKAIDGIVLEKSQAQRFVQNNSDFSYFVIDKYTSEFAIGMSLDSPYKDDINKVLNELKEQGELKSIQQKWLGQ